MNGPATTRAVLIDALGTLVELEPPWERLAPELGMEPAVVREAFLAEMAVYRERAVTARDDESLRGLREECARVLSEGLGREVSVAVMMGSIRFRAFGDAAPALSRLRGLGLRVVCLSNWDHALGAVLERVGLLTLLDGVVTSAAVGAPKPGRRIFDAGLRAAGTDAAQTLHVGDSPEEDVAGARAAGIRALLLDRSGAGDISSLAEIPRHL